MQVHLQVHESNGQMRAVVQAFAQRLAIDCTCESEHGLLPNLELYALGDHLRVHMPVHLYPTTSVHPVVCCAFGTVTLRIQDLGTSTCCFAGATNSPHNP